MPLLGDFLNVYGLYVCPIVWIWIMLLAGFLMSSACSNWILIWSKFTCQNFFKWIVINEYVVFMEYLCYRCELTGSIVVMLIICIYFDVKR